LQFFKVTKIPHVLALMVRLLGTWPLTRQAELVAHGSGIAVLYERGPIGYWDFETGTKTNLLENQDSVALTFSPDGEWLAAGHFSGDISIWRTADWRPGHTLSSAFRMDALARTIRWSGKKVARR
jgi:WD40 repeat protein